MRDLNKMNHLMLFCLLVVGPQLIITITVTPSHVHKNVTLDIEKSFSKNVSIGSKLESLSERNRRLIPYMTFYVPQNELPINQHYATNQQKERQQQQLQNSQEAATNPTNHQSFSASPSQPQVIAVYEASPTLQSLSNRLQHSQSNHHLLSLPQKQQSSATEANNNHVNTHSNGHGTFKVVVPAIPNQPQQIYSQLLYQDYPRNQLTLQKINGAQFQSQSQQQHHSQHEIDYNLSKVKSQAVKLFEQQYQIQQAQQQLATKSKVNYSPFTEYNKMPGHFTPIIYTNKRIKPVITSHSNIANNQYKEVLDDNVEILKAEKDNLQENEQNNFEAQQQQQRITKQQLQQYYQYHNLQQPNHNTEQNQNELHAILPLPIPQNQNHIGISPNIIVSSTQRPQQFQILTEIPAQKHRYPSNIIFHQKPDLQLSISEPLEQSSQHLTPQQKYVVFLQQQIRHKQQQLREQDQHKQRYQQQQLLQHHKLHYPKKESENYPYNDEAYVINSSPTPLHTVPENHESPMTYQKNHPQEIYTKLKNNNPQYVYRQKLLTPNDNQEKEFIYVEQDPNHFAQTAEEENKQQNNKFFEYIEISNIQPSRPPPLSSTSDTLNTQNENKFESPTPTIITPVSSTFNKHNKQHNSQTQRLQPIINHSSGTPSSTLSPLKKHKTDAKIHRYNTHQPQIFIENPAIYLPNIKQPIRQHLTETTQVPPPKLTTHQTKTSHHHNLQNNYYNRFYQQKPTTQLLPTIATLPAGSLKLQPSQNYRPVSVTTLRPTSQSLTDTYHDLPPTHHRETITKYQPEKIPSDIHMQPLKQQSNHQELPDITSNSLAEILRKLQDSNHLPRTITPDNIDNSIKTLIKILNNLKESQTIVENPPQHHDDDYRDYDDTPINSDPSQRGPNSGRAGIDYPVFYEIPHTNFNCKEQRYKGFFGDPETNCQVWHYCDLNGGQASFLCPNGTIFSQVALTCDWWFNVKCSSTAQLYVLNERLYKYILPFTPKFPEDYSGPLVDKYLALKFKEMEEKMSREKLKGREKSKDNEEGDNNDSKTSTTETHNESDTLNNIKIYEDHENRNKDIDIRSQNSSEYLTVKSVNLEDVEENRGSVDTGITYNTVNPNTEHSLTAKPIVVSSTTMVTPLYQSTPNHAQFAKILSTFRPSKQYKHTSGEPRVSVESEQVEVIEIKTDGSSGHLVPSNL